MLTLALALSGVPDLLFGGAARDTAGSLAFRGGFFTSGALQLLTFFLVLYVLGIHSLTLIPAYFSTIFFNPYRGNLLLVSHPRHRLRDGGRFRVRIWGD